MAVQNQTNQAEEKIPLIVTFVSIRRLLRLLEMHGIKYRHNEKRRTIKIKGSVTHIILHSCGFHFQYSDDKRLMICRSESYGSSIWIFDRAENADRIDLPKEIEIMYDNGYLYVQYPP